MSTIISEIWPYFIVNNINSNLNFNISYLAKLVNLRFLLVRSNYKNFFLIMGYYYFLQKIYQTFNRKNKLLLDIQK